MRGLGLDYVKPLAVDAVHAFGFGGPMLVPPLETAIAPPQPVPSGAVTWVVPAACERCGKAIGASTVPV